ncbi:GmrSD restriction endonuclease domain-containing protein [Pseudalkalibacillus sp. R45]|uniref:GmrSD restriction endonuclease domain-containing protein n=1 Tax=Pseudalkalibacillus sp. R45 TaxID=3457433 RepID=UPI003FCD85AC
MSNYQVNNTTINALISWIEEEIVAIPEIQRPFVWKPTKVRNLIDSLYNDYPVGYIITWQNPDARLKDGTISHGKKILIDGQQRVTAIMAAISGKEVVTKDYNKRKIKIAFNPIEEAFEVENPAIRKNKKWIPDISEVFKPGFDTLGFIQKYCDLNPEIDMNDLNRILQKLTSIKYSSIGIIELSHTLDIEVVTEIFIRINSAGVNLSQADFAMSKISVNDQYKGPLIRKTVDYFCHLIKNPSIYQNIIENDQEFSQTTELQKIKWVKDYNTNIYEPSYSDLLRVAFTFKFLRGKISNLVSLLSGRDFETREYKEEIIENSFESLHDGVLKFVNETNFKRFIIILKSAGIINSKLVRSQNALNFAYTLFLLLRDKKVNDSIINQVVRRWLITSILTERYSGSPESMFDYDIKRFVAHDNPIDYVKKTEAGELSNAYWENILPSNLNTSVTSSPYFNLYIISQIYDKDYAFLSKSITVQQLIEERGDVHHVFPKKYLQANGFNNRGQYNQIANYAYTEQVVNLAVRAQSPKAYLTKVKEQIKDSQIRIGEIDNMDDLVENFKMNCIPQSLFEMEATDYERFLEERRSLIVDKIRSYFHKL